MWDGEIHDEQQARLNLHTRLSLVDRIVERTKQDHADDVPCVIALPVVNGNPDYIRWVLDETEDRL
jgi:periplasmic divalent cation tolerance protein